MKKNDQFNISAVGLEGLESRFALRVAAGLTERTFDIGADLAERLRFAREQALERARLARAPAPAESSVGVTNSGAVVLGAGPGWWVKLASAFPLLVLLGGLMLIQQWHTRAQINVATDIDAALLADDVPPDAYSDPGFVEFLKTPRE